MPAAPGAARVCNQQQQQQQQQQYKIKKRIVYVRFRRRHR